MFPKNDQTVSTPSEDQCIRLSSLRDRRETPSQIYRINRVNKQHEEVVLSDESCLVVSQRTRDTFQTTSQEGNNDKHKISQWMMEKSLITDESKSQIYSLLPQSRAAASGLES